MDNLNDCALNLQFPSLKTTLFWSSGSSTHALGFISESEEHEEKKQRKSNYK